PPPPRSTLFPYTTLFRSKQGKKVSFSKRLGSRNQPGTEQFRAGTLVPQRLKNVGNGGTSFTSEFREGVRQLSPSDLHGTKLGGRDRKSTRLNSSHLVISY